MQEALIEVITDGEELAIVVSRHERGFFRRIHRETIVLDCGQAFALACAINETLIKIKEGNAHAKN